ncbi:MAG: NAD(P)H-dependent oxidoreductase [Chitinispirillaceae bacterium]|nr:NAD(P)H-dependent oxidoreductase [Chitinispirillaceae bacterium]
MNILIVLAHPNQRSFNHAIAQRVSAALKRSGHTVIFHDLYAEKFNPLLSVDDLVKDRILDSKARIYCDELEDCDGLVFVHPNWWGGPPAVLKGWLDRVLRPGIAYAFDPADSGGGVPKGLLTGKTALVFNTADTPEAREREVFGDPLEQQWKKCVFEFCGVTKYHRKTFSVIVESSAAQRQEWLAEAETIALGLFAVPA